MKLNRVIIALENPLSPWHLSEAERGDSIEYIHIWTRGQAWLGEACLREQALAEWWATRLSTTSNSLEEAFRGALGVLNGSFAVVLHTPSVVLAAVDRVRSIPLYYGQQGHLCMVSDDARKVRDFVAAQSTSMLASYEFLLLGYVTGGDTLFPSVRQLQAGEVVRMGAVSEGSGFSTHRYYRFLHKDLWSAPAEELFPILDSIFARAFERLAQSSRGQTLVIPLSGGLDSRLISVMLKRLGMENVICFSYGRPGNRESRISRDVASTLGYPWHFVPYTRTAWATWFHSEERKAFYRYCDGLSSLPVIQDWPAIWDMKKQGLIPENSVFVPGHTGDFLSGKHIPRGIQDHGAVGRDRLVNEILKKHYVLWDWHAHQNTLRPELAKRIYAQLEGLSAETAEEAASAFEAWEWQERQAKFIINSVRAYEFWGYGWRLPFWDSEVMDFWSRVPLVLRRQQSLYVKYLASVLGGTFQEKEYATHSSLSITKRVADRLKITPALVRTRQAVRHFGIDYLQHPLAWYGIHSWRHHLTFRTDAGLPEGLVVAMPQNINAYLAMDYLATGFSNN